LAIGPGRGKKQVNSNKWSFAKNVDLDELNMTKDVADFDRNFLRYLRISIEQERAVAKSKHFVARRGRLQNETQEM